MTLASTHCKGVLARQEFFAAFGPTAADVERYFDYRENYARNRPPIRDISSDPKGALEKLKRVRGHYLAYPPEVYRPAEAILAKALAVSRQIAGTLPFGVPFRGQDRFQEADGITRVTVEVEWDTPWGWLGRAIEFFSRPLLQRQFRSNARTAARLLTDIQPGFSPSSLSSDS